MLGRRKEPPGAPVFGFFGGWRQKGGRGTKREETASNVRRKKTWKVQNLKRAGSPFLPEKGGRAGGAAEPASASRWSAAVRPFGLMGKRTSGEPWETRVEPRVRNKALKRKAHERGELRQASVGRRTDAAKRVAKP